MYALPSNSEVIDYETAVSLLLTQVKVAKFSCIYDGKAVFETGSCYYQGARSVEYRFYIPLSDPMFYQDQGIYHIQRSQFMQYIEFMRYAPMFRCL